MIFHLLCTDLLIRKQKRFMKGDDIKRTVANFLVKLMMIMIVKRSGSIAQWAKFLKKNCPFYWRQIPKIVSMLR